MNCDILFIDGLNFKHLEPSSIGYIFPLASVLEQEKYTLKIFNISLIRNYSIQGIIEELVKHSFFVIGISTNAENIRNVYKLCKKLKKVFPSVPIILGGPQATYWDKKILEDTIADYIIRNDGEIKLIKLLDYIIKKQGNLFEIEGISFKNGNQFIRNEDKNFNYNQMPTPQYAILKDSDYWLVPNDSIDNFDYFINGLRNQYMIFMTGRGCPYSCAFCVEGNLQRKYLYREISKVETDLEYFLEITNQKIIAIGDDTFTSSPKRVHDLCKLFKKIQKKHPFKWYAEGRVDILSKNLGLIHEMYDAGLYKLQIGIESGDQNVLNAYNKKITLEQIKAVIKEAGKYENLLIHGNVMLCNPFQTSEELIKSLDFIKELFVLSNFKLDIGCGYLAPFAGTPIERDPQKYGIEKLFENFEFERFGIGEVTCKPIAMSLEEADKLQSLVEFELNSFLLSNIFNSSKQMIDARIHLIDENGAAVNSTSWSKTFNKLYSFHRYKKAILSHSTKDSNNANIAELYPMRLWEIEYNESQKAYSYFSLKGEKKNLANLKKILWELASGKYSCQEILQIVKEYSIFINSNITINEICNIYKELEEDLAIVFRDY